MITSLFFVGLIILVVGLSNKDLPTTTIGADTVTTGLATITDNVEDFKNMLDYYAAKVPTKIETKKAINASLDFIANDTMSMNFQLEHFQELLTMFPYLDEENKIAAWNYLTTLILEDSVNKGETANLVKRFKVYHEEVGKLITNHMNDMEPENTLPESAPVNQEPTSNSRFWKTIIVVTGTIIFTAIHYMSLIEE